MRIAREVSASSDFISPFQLTLPPALLEKATNRLGWISLMAAVSTILLFVTEAILQPEIQEIQDKSTVRLTALAMVVLSLAFVGLSRLGILSRQTLLNIGTAYQVLIALGISIFENSMPMDDGLVRGVSNVCVWISLFGTLVPNAPLMSLAGSFGCALVWSLGHFLSCNFYGYETMPWNRMLTWTAPSLLCAIWVYFVNRQIFLMQLRQQKAEELGAYELGSRIGSGGMGEVWRASHRMLARGAAIKLIRPDVLSNQSDRQAQMLRKRFEREARVTAGLQSPHTVALYDFGLSQDGSFYYVMELLNGLDLQTLVDRFGPLPPARVIHVMRQVCSSLEEAHRAGLVHRDIKPRNIFLCRLGLEYDFAKVLDFGLVKSSRGLDDVSVMTAQGTAAGTPAYMPPEIALGHAKIDGRTDVYALGCVAYFLLTGSLVFEENSATALALAHVQKSPVPPSQRTEVPIPAELDALIMACLEKTPEARPRSAQEVSRRLDAVAGARWTREEAWKWWHVNSPESPLTASYDKDEQLESTVSAVA